MSRTRDTTDVDSTISQSKRSVFEHDSSDHDSSGEACSRGNGSLPSNIRPDFVRDRVAIKTQAIYVAERVTHLVFIRSEPDARQLRAKLLGHPRAITVRKTRPSSAGCHLGRRLKRWHHTVGADPFQKRSVICLPARQVQVRHGMPGL
jgi:hypothetical protein